MLVDGGDGGGGGRGAADEDRPPPAPPAHSFFHACMNFVNRHERCGGVCDPGEVFCQGCASASEACPLGAPGAPTTRFRVMAGVFNRPGQGRACDLFHFFDVACRCLAAPAAALFRLAEDMGASPEVVHPDLYGALAFVYDRVRLELFLGEDLEFTEFAAKFRQMEETCANVLSGRPGPGQDPAWAAAFSTCFVPADPPGRPRLRARFGRGAAEWSARMRDAVSRGVPAQIEAAVAAWDATDVPTPGIEPVRRFRWTSLSSLHESLGGGGVYRSDGAKRPRSGPE